ncbi:MAG: YceI family protein [Deltaproteobacteria bacterium]|nr:YceI family protein [Deltaproteobacteria bacterium]
MATTTDGTIRLYSFKDGMLSRLGHDLQLGIGRFSIAVEGTTVNARFDPLSIVVDGAVERGALQKASPSMSDRAEILDKLRDKVLEIKKYSEIVFVGELDRAADTISGTLRLHGQERPLCVAFARREGRLIGHVSLTPSQWGIKPFRALLGALKLQDRVELDFDLPETLITEEAAR